MDIQARHRNHAQGGGGNSSVPALGWRRRRFELSPTAAVRSEGTIAITDCRIARCRLWPLAVTPVGDTRGSFWGVSSTGRRNTPRWSAPTVGAGAISPLRAKTLDTALVPSSGSGVIRHYWQLGNVHRDKERLVAREPFHRQPPLRFILEIHLGKVLAVAVRHDEGFLTFLDRPWPGEAARHGPQLPPYRVCSS